MHKIVSLLVLLSALLVVPVVQADIVVNGGFDANSPLPETAPMGWTFTPASNGTDFFVGNESPGPLSPPNSANFGATGTADDELSQVLPTVVGQTYTLDYFLAHNFSDRENDFSVQWNGITIPGSVLMNTAAFGYTEFTFSGLLATTNATTLAFFGREVPEYYLLDNVSVNPSTSPVPEPGYLAVLPAALGVLLFARKRRPA